MPFTFVIGRTAYYVHTNVGKGGTEVVVQEQPLDPVPAAELEPSSEEA